MNSPSNSLSISRRFSTIYIEEGALNHPTTQQISKRFPKARIIPIERYQEVFNRHQQSFAAQKQSQQLILAKRTEEFLYEGSSIAPNFGEQNVFYNTIALNCLYNCEYCYLQGMFPSAHLVLFVNNGDFIGAVGEKLRTNPSLYLCLSYDTDLLALEDLTGFCAQWIEFGREHKNLTLELRTKSAAIKPLLEVEPHPGVILAWTIAPSQHAQRFEQGAPSTKARLQAMKQAAAHGYKVRVCLDPIIPFDLHSTEREHTAWRDEYRSLLRLIADELSEDSISEISLGTFRIGKSYFKKLSKNRPRSLFVHQDYEDRDGVMCFSKEHEDETLAFVREEALSHFAPEKIDLWTA